jgi:hypothetical protein
MSNILQTDLYGNSASREHNLGELLIDKWGRKFRYVQAGAVDLVTGNLQQEAAEDTNYYSMAVQAAVAAGAFAIPVTLGGTAVTANQFEGGDLTIESSTGIGQNFKIVSHTVQTSTSGTCTFTVDRAVETALTTSSQATVRKNAYDGVIVFPTTPTGGPTGVAIHVITAAQFGWIQSGGDGSVLFDNGVNVAADAVGIMPSAAVAGSVSPAAAADVSPTYIGFSRAIVSVDSTQGMAHLTID